MLLPTLSRSPFLGVGIAVGVGIDSDFDRDPDSDPECSPMGRQRLSMRCLTVLRGAESRAIAVASSDSCAPGAGVEPERPRRASANRIVPHSGRSRRGTSANLWRDGRPGERLLPTRRPNCEPARMENANIERSTSNVEVGSRLLCSTLDVGRWVLDVSPHGVSGHQPAGRLSSETLSAPVRVTTTYGAQALRSGAERSETASRTAGATCGSVNTSPCVRVRQLVDDGKGSV